MYMYEGRVSKALLWNSRIVDCHIRCATLNGVLRSLFKYKVTFSGAPQYWTLIFSTRFTKSICLCFSWLNNLLRLSADNSAWGHRDRTEFHLPKKFNFDVNFVNTAPKTGKIMAYYSHIFSNDTHEMLFGPLLIISSDFVAYFLLCFLEFKSL